MPLMHGLLNLIMLAITIWCYWRILDKAGLSPFWAFLLILSLAIAYLASVADSPVVLIAPYIMPAIMIWIFAFIRWPSFEAASEVTGGAAGDSRFAQQGRDRRDVAPSADPHRSVNPKLRRKRKRRRGGE
ncbi:MAG TPA: hypothetical protein QF630_08765 [Alphaproteobacteria bacterium]|jgi:thiol:disulfide interchange protein|nr:hypothetical protein [Alphaproteobacteria bacterium]HJN61119.1 hypothetical protein [Alphaproteobacteria bacterium]